MHGGHMLSRSPAANDAKSYVDELKVMKAYRWQGRYSCVCVCALHMFLFESLLSTRAIFDRTWGQNMFEGAQGWRKIDASLTKARQLSEDTPPTSDVRLKKLPKPCVSFKQCFADHNSCIYWCSELLKFDSSGGRVTQGLIQDLTQVKCAIFTYVHMHTYTSTRPPNT